MARGRQLWATESHHLSGLKEREASTSSCRGGVARNTSAAGQLRSTGRKRQPCTWYLCTASTMGATRPTPSTPPACTPFCSRAGIKGQGRLGSALEDEPGQMRPTRCSAAAIGHPSLPAPRATSRAPHSAPWGRHWGQTPWRTWRLGAAREDGGGGGSATVASGGSSEAVAAPAPFPAPIAPRSGAGSPAQRETPASKGARGPRAHPSTAAVVSGVRPSIRIGVLSAKLRSRTGLRWDDAASPRHRRSDASGKGLAHGFCIHRSRSLSGSWQHHATLQTQASVVAREPQ